MTKLIIHYLEKAVVDLSEKDRVALYDSEKSIGTKHGVSIPIERFLKIVEAVQKELSKEEICKHEKSVRVEHEGGCGEIYYTYKCEKCNTPLSYEETIKGSSTEEEI